MKRIIALIGNQNSGKTTLFNRLTGGSQRTGNFPGVTIEKKEGSLKGHTEVTVVDLPGIYSLSVYSLEETITRDFIQQETPDIILNIVDATNLERSLYLSLQLMELQRPMIIALNMMDEIQKSGGFINSPILSQTLGIPVIPISAAKNLGIADLTDWLISPSSCYNICWKNPQFSGEAGKALEDICCLISQDAKKQGFPVPFAAVKLLEGDMLVKDSLVLPESTKETIEDIIQEMERNLQTDREAAVADMRYSYIEELCTQCFRRPKTAEKTYSEKIDALLTHKYWGIPIFLGIMAIQFTLAFHILGPPLQNLLHLAVENATALIQLLLEKAQISLWLEGLIIEGICAGVGSVLSFLPIVLLLYLFLSLLEDSGYMARAAFLMDRPLRKIGLSGHSFVPMILGFGCSVPAILACRTLPSRRDRNMTVFMIPFLSCSAKLPIYGMITAAFFPDTGAAVMLLVYGIGMAVAVLSALLMKRFRYPGASVPFVMELPPYRLPSPQTILSQVQKKAEDFIKRAFSLILCASIIIWFLENFNCQLTLTLEKQDSLLAQAASFFAPLCRPLGFSDWRAFSALMAGVCAKEAVVSTLFVLTSSDSQASLIQALHQIFTPLSAFSFLVFTVLYMPCVAAFAAAKRELGSCWAAVKVVLFQTGLAYLAAVFCYQAGRFLILFLE